MRLIKNSTLLFIFIVLLEVSVSIAAPAYSTEEILEELGGYPCPDSEFTCVTLTLPLDHFDESNSETIDVVFGVLPATGERKGMFVVVTGGPGTSGLMAADSYVPYYDLSIAEHFDIVFFDQRGSVQSGNIQCPVAASTYYATDTASDTPEQESALIETAKTFADNCVEEIDFAPETLAFYGTRQAIEDLEAFRGAIGEEKFWLYGESYGTQYAQAYAATHPERLEALILDGTVDLTLTIDEYYAEQAQTFDELFVWLSEACSEDESCAADVAGGDLLTFYDELTAELATSPISFQFPLASGKFVERTLTLADLEYTVTNSVYTETGRFMLQRALAAASQGNLVTLARLVYSTLALDPETLETYSDSSYSDAMFYAVECNDYASFSGTPEERAEAYIRAGDELDASVPRFNSVFYGDLPCVFWPGNPPDERPAPLVAEGFPTLVLGATADAYTPVENGERVYSRLNDGYLVTTDGGAHITFAWGNACPDELVTAFLVEDTMPEERESRCEGFIADPYVPNTPAQASSYADPLEALNTAYNEIYYLPEYYYWDTETLTVLGCTYGGTLAFAPSSEGQQFYLSDCAFSQGFIMTGTGFSSDGVSDFMLDVLVSGDADGALVYTYDSEGNIAVTGEYDGESVELSG
jgi:pimeloyl-ACP methyl ester carboxylesterase